MLQLKSRLLALACAICAVGWCLASKSNAASASIRDAGPAASSTADVQHTEAAPSINCNKVFVPADVSGILAAPATISPEKLLGPNGCKFETADGAIITTYLGSDMDAEVMWNDVSATVDRRHYTPMSGVGDAAFWWDAGASAYFVAKKGDDYCRVELGIPGGAGAAKARGVELAKRLAVLCTKAFATK